MSYLLCRADAARIPLGDGTCHVCVTSPPYWGLRDYGTARWEGGDVECDHAKDHSMETSGLEGGKTTTLHAHYYRALCRKCGARRIDSQIGLEGTPEAYVAKMVEVFREVWRVLRPDGTAWVNLGDSYTNAAHEYGRNDADRKWKGLNGESERSERKRSASTPGLKPKDLVGIPWRVAFALQADGWYLRSDIIWAKPNPMPESVTDRPTKSHEYLFLLSKQERYYWDQEAVRSLSVDPPGKGRGGSLSRIGNDQLIAANNHRGDPAVSSGSRNIRTVWTIPTEAFPGSHFATFPRKLVEPCIKAGSSERGCCPVCGAPWERVTEINPEYAAIAATNRGWSHAENGLIARQKPDHPSQLPRKNKTTGWRPTCPHKDAEPIPCTVLDIFGGSQTTGVVALALGRRYVGLDLSTEYLSMGQRRISRPHLPVQRSGRAEHHPLFRDEEPVP